MLSKKTIHSLLVDHFEHCLKLFTNSWLKVNSIHKVIGCMINANLSRTELGTNRSTNDLWRFDPSVILYQENPNCEPIKMPLWCHRLHSTTFFCEACPFMTRRCGHVCSDSFLRENLFKTHPHIEELAYALISVFVSIEMTGQGVQFESKFKYRQPMYLALEYMLEIDLHKNAIQVGANDILSPVATLELKSWTCWLTRVNHRQTTIQFCLRHRDVFRVCEVLWNVCVHACVRACMCISTSYLCCSVMIAAGRVRWAAHWWHGGTVVFTFH